MSYWSSSLHILIIIDSKSKSLLALQGPFSQRQSHVLIVSGSWKEHLGHLGRLFRVLGKEGLTCRRSKCVFGKVQLEFLGPVVGGGVMNV